MYLQRVFEGIDVEDYLKSRLCEFLKAIPQDQGTTLLHSFTKSSNNGVTPLFLPSDNLEGAAEVIAFAKDTLKLFPLTSGEKIIEEELCVLAQQNLDIDGSCLYLKQRTNFAEIFIGIPNKVAREGSIVTLSNNNFEASDDLEEIPEKPVITPIALITTALALKLAKTLGLKLLNAGVNAGGSYIWNIVKKEVLGQTSLPDYYQEVYKETSNIIKHAFNEHYIKEIRDLARDFDLTTDKYNNFGRSTERFQTIDKRSTALITRSNDLGSPGAFHYAEATILYIMVLQEDYQRLIEAGASSEQLARSKKYISSMATQFAVNVEKKRNNLIFERMAKISDKPFYYWSPSVSPNPGRIIGGVHEGAYGRDGQRANFPAPVVSGNKFEDQENGFWVKRLLWPHDEVFNPKFSWNWVNSRLQRYRNAIYEEIVNKTQPMVDVAQTLKDIADKPV